MVSSPSITSIDLSPQQNIEKNDFTAGCRHTSPETCRFFFPEKTLALTPEDLHLDYDRANDMDGVEIRFLSRFLVEKKDEGIKLLESNGL